MKIRSNPLTDKPTSGYVGIYQDYETEEVRVWERDINGERTLHTYRNKPYFYIEADDGDKLSLFGDKVKRLNFSSAHEARNASKKYKEQGRKVFETDFSLVDRTLMDFYFGVDAPKLNTAFYDIETDYDPERPFSKPKYIVGPDGKNTRTPDDSCMYAPINAVTIYKQWKKEYVTIVVPPKSFTGKLPKTVSLEDLDSDVVTRIVQVDDETHLFLEFFKEIEHADVLSGWNSEFFDMPYMVMRSKLLSEQRGSPIKYSKWSLPGAGLPRLGEVESYGSEKPTVSLSDTGRTHVDYLRLFQKFTFEGRSSYSLAAIAEEELDIPKLEYEGSLADLYNNDFIHFIKYNVRDVEIIHRLDEKYKFVNLANMMSHENTVPLDAVLGTVKYVETGLSNYAHNVMNRIVGDKCPTSTEKVEGAVVLTPRIGLHKWIGSVDLNSLYPSVIRSLNISPEKIIGQFINNEEDWVGIIAFDELPHSLRLEDGEVITQTGEEWLNLFKSEKWAISAYGTVFDQSSGKGLIPTVLEEWYLGRKKLQAEKKKWTKIRKDFEDAGDTSSAKYVEAKHQEDYFDLLQLTRKIQLNSCYGALLNAFFRFFRMEMGASVTATGRQITTHMMGTIGELLSGVYSKLHSYSVLNKDGSISKFYETPKDSPVIYGDTDSAYFLTYANNKEEAVAIADEIAEGVNASFSGYMIKSFNCQAPDFHDLIKAGREIVGIRGLFQAKKKYMIKVVDLEGVATDKLKSMGSEIKKADTPKPIQKFLKTTVDKILDGQEFSDVEIFVNEQRKKLFSKSAYDDIITLGVARAANNLEAQYDDYCKIELKGKGKVRLPGHIRAACIYNQLSLRNEGPGAKLLQSGDKVKVFYVKSNPFGYTSIAFPADITKFPNWFTENFVVDVKLTEEKMIDAKLEGIFSAWGYEVPTVQGAFIKTIIEF